MVKPLIVFFFHAFLAFLDVSINLFKFFWDPEIFYLGLLEIVIGLLVTVFPSLWLPAWAVGFGLLHIVYGLVMYGKYGK